MSTPAGDVVRRKRQAELLRQTVEMRAEEIELRKRELEVLERVATALENGNKVGGPISNLTASIERLRDDVRGLRNFMR